MLHLLWGTAITPDQNIIVILRSIIHIIMIIIMRRRRRTMINVSDVPRIGISDSDRRPRTYNIT